MPTGYTQLIIDGTVKTPKEFLHLCLRNFEVCISMRDMPLDSQEDYTEYIKKYHQDLIDYYTKALENAKAEYERVINLSDDGLYEMYAKVFSDIRDYYQKRIDEISKFQSFYDAIKNWDCSEEFDNIKSFALTQINNISKYDIDPYIDMLLKGMFTKGEFISNHKDEYKKELLQKSEWDINYYQKMLDTTIKDMNNALTFYERFKKEIEEL